MDVYRQVAEAAKYEDELIELRGQLQMTELHVQQVCNCDGHPFTFDLPVCCVK